MYFVRACLCVILLLAAGPAAGQAIERETLSAVGWNAACSVAVAHYGYPPIGQGMRDDPVLTEIGTLTIGPGAPSSRVQWDINWTGVGTWQPGQAARALSDLAAAGYSHAGFAELVRPQRISSQSGPAQVLLSTAVFAMRSTAGWPSRGWNWDQVVYSPLGNCALFVFRADRQDAAFYRFLLLRVYNPSARGRRAQAHLDSAGLTYDAGDLPGALEESAIAAQMVPDLAGARYRHAAMLCLSGRSDESLAELEAAFRLDPKLKAKAPHDPDFESLRAFSRFQSLTGG